MINVKKLLKKTLYLNSKLLNILPATRKINLRKSQKIWKETDK